MLVSQSYPTVCDRMDVAHQAPLSRDFWDKNTGLGCHFLLQDIFIWATSEARCVHIYICVCVCVCVYIYTYIYMYVCVYICMYVYIYTHIHICMYVCMLRLSSWGTWIQLFHGMWDFSSMTRDQTRVTTFQGGFSITGPPGKFLFCISDSTFKWYHMGFLFVCLT